MSEKRLLLLGFAFSPSVWAQGSELEDYYQSAVKPFLKVAYNYADIPFVLFFSGPLLTWLQTQHTEAVTVLQEMLKRKQLEILGGGFYAPLLPLIPSSDRLGQIEELTTTVRKSLGKRPRGLWLTKSVWDPGLVSTLAASGIDYTFLDESEFQRLGLIAAEAGAPRLTEHQGRLLTVFPRHDGVSRDVQSGDWTRLQQWLHANGPESPRLLSLFFNIDSVADCRMFEHPEQSFEAVLTLIRSEFPSVEAVTAAGYLKRQAGPLGRSFFTGTTYQELCLRGGLAASGPGDLQSWKQFLSHDPAANSLYNKMVYVNLLVSSLRGDKYKKRSACDDLWKAQTATAFLGADSEALALERRKAFASLLNAEVLLRDRANFTPALSSHDFDLDGVKEFLYQGHSFNYYIDPVGGQLFEWDCLDRPGNFIDVSSSEDRLNQVFVDRFFRMGRPDQDAARFFTREYKLQELNREQKYFQLSVVDSVEGDHGVQPLRLKKAFTFHEAGLHVDYDLELLAGPAWEGWFSSELHGNFGLHGPVEVRSPELPGVSESVVWSDAGRKLVHRWSWQPAANVATLLPPLSPRWWMILRPGEPWRCRLSLQLTREG